MQAIVGMLLFVALAYLLSENRRGVAWRAVAFGIGLQFVLAVVLLKIPVVSQVLFGLNQFVVCLLYTSPSPRDISGSRMPSSA